MKKTFDVGERVLWTVLVNNPGHHKPGDKILETIIGTYSGPPVYRIELDQVWNERMKDVSGQKIIASNVRGREVSFLEK